MRYRHLVFCTAPIEKVRDAARLVLPKAAPDEIAYVGPDGSPFCRMPGLKFISWGNGPFSWIKGVGLWISLAARRPWTAVLPLNNREGDGYLALRVFSLFAIRGSIIEVNTDGRAQAVNAEYFLRRYRIEKNLYSALFSIFSMLTPLFRLWLQPQPAAGKTASGKPLEYEILNEPEYGISPEASVIIRAYNEEATIRRTLEAVIRQEGVSKEIVVIDSQSTDGTLRIAREFPVRIVQIAKASFGYGAALNLGARLARGRFVVNLSAHAVPADSRWLKNLIRPLQGADGPPPADNPLPNAKVAGVHGREMPMPGYSSKFEIKILADSFKKLPIRRVDDCFFSNANSAIPRNLLLQYPFDESAAWAEDQLWTHRMQKLGYATVYRPDAAVYHSHNLTLKQNFARCRKYFQTLFARVYVGNAASVCDDFRNSLVGRSASFRRFLVRRRLMHPLAAFLYAPFVEFSNYLGCETAWQDMPRHADAPEEIASAQPYNQAILP